MWFSSYNNNKKRESFYIYAIDFGVNFIPVIIMITFLVCTSFVKTRYLLKVVFHSSISVKSTLLFQVTLFDTDLLPWKVNCFKTHKQVDAGRDHGCIAW